MDLLGRAILRSNSAFLYELSTSLEGADEEASTRKGAVSHVFDLFLRLQQLQSPPKNLRNGQTLLRLYIDLCPQVMQVALLLLLAAPLAGLAAPIEKPSSRYHLICVEKSANELSPTCYRRWRHHGHLTFRLARVQSCSETDQQDLSANTHVHPDSVYNRGAIAWIG